MTEDWVRFVYRQGFRSNDPARAADLIHADPWFALARGDVSGIGDPNEAGGPLRMPPLVAVTFSGMIMLERFAPALRRAAAALIDAGADVDQTWVDAAFPDSPLSALYGAAGLNHDAEMTRLLLERGANPNDGESVYHSLERTDLVCTRLLLDAGAKVPGTNAVGKVLDFDNLEGLRLLLRHGADPNERQPVLHAIRRRRSVAHFEELLKAGANPGGGAYRMAMLYGLPDVAALLTPQELNDRDLFIAACARGERAEWPGGLDTEQLRMLANMAAAGCSEAVRAMVESGWPIDVRGGDWNASALNLALFRGDAEMTRFLLAHSADWRVPHGYNDNAVGTLSFASLNNGPGDWVECARALIESGMPLPGEEYRFAPDVTEYFARAGRA
jgi:ankyrin repeat protein